ncbi:MAG: MHYT domain-containing protein [Oligoflexales bacterium]
MTFLRLHYLPKLPITSMRFLLGLRKERIAMVMETRFDLFLVVLSVLVAIFASYTALNLAQTVNHAKGRAKTLWLSCGALAMGVGIWSMHFIGMLAFEMPGMMMGYDIPLMALSVVVAIGSSALAMYIISRRSVPPASVVAGGIAMAAAISGMHYIGMYSMRMDAIIKWNLFLVVLSVLIALIASFSALLILIRLRDKVKHFWELLIASSLMGFAISGMHYTGMLAATFVHTTKAGIATGNLLVSDELAVTVVSTTLFILALALASSISQKILTTRFKKFDENLTKSEERFRLLVEAVKEYSIVMLDPNGRITTWNSGAERITGYTDREVLGQNVSIFFADEQNRDQIARRQMQTAKEIGHFEGEILQLRKDGSKYWASVVVAPLYDKERNLTGFSKVTRDITEVKEAERQMKQLNEDLEHRVKKRTRALEKRETQLRTITNAVPVIIAQLNKSERFLFCNEAFLKWFKPGFSPIGKTLLEVLGKERYAVNEPYLKKVLKGQSSTYERESVTDTASAIFSITFVPEFDSDNHVVGFIIVANDITAQKEAQTELKTAKEVADDANATKSAFLANMSHEIRTPLGAILGFSELLLNDEMTGNEKVNCVEVIKRNGTLLSNIINDILDLSKVEAGKLSIEKIDVPLSEVLKEIGAVLSLEASEKGIDFRVTAEGVIPATIKTDPIRLRQILFNIVGNAIKFTSRGSVHVKIQMATDNEGKTRLAFVVKDTGVGISKEKASNLFAPFTQADVSTTRRYGGTGLGLVLAKRLAVVLGGDVVLNDSAPGRGSTFVVTIDPGISEQVLFQKPDQPLSNLVHLPDKSNKINLNSMRILLVEDSMDNQALVKKILELAGAKVETANNGREGVEKALNEDFSLVLMDLQMPELDGYEATKILRDKGFKKPIIALTAHAMKEEAQRSLRSGFDNHITKPVDHRLLVNTLAKYAA